MKLSQIRRTGAAAGVLALMAGVGYYGSDLAAALPQPGALPEAPQTFTLPAAPVALTCPDPLPASSGSAVELMPGIAGSTSSWAEEGEQRGLAVAACAAPAAEHWLVGGASTAGQTATITLSNPGARPASVTLEVYGVTGQLALGSRSLIPIAPGQAVTVPLDAIAPEQSRLAVHATARGSLVTATLASTSLAGTTADGVELIGSSANLSNSLVLAGLRSDGQGIGDPTAPTVRLLSPTVDAVAQFTVIGLGGAVDIPGLNPVTLKAGVPADVSLGGIEPGEYAVIVSANHPIVGAGRWTRATGNAHDSAWLPATSPATSSSALLAAGLQAALVIAAPADATAPITGTVSGRLDLGFELTPDGIVVLDVPFDAAPGLLTVAADAPIVWGLAVSAAHDPGLVAGLAPSSIELITGVVTVQQTSVR